MKLVFLGDSTMQYNDSSTFPQVGWPQGLIPYLKKDIDVFNYAHNGCSTKTIVEYGYYQKAIDKIDKDAIAIFEFGHNDEHTQDLERYTTPIEYKENLRKMIKEVHKKGASFVLLSPICRRNFVSNNIISLECHKDYLEACEELSKEEDVYFVNMARLTKTEIEKMGDEKSKELFMQFGKNIYSNYPEGKSDNTHLVKKGADLIASIFYKNTKNFDIFKGIYNEF